MTSRRDFKFDRRPPGEIETNVRLNIAALDNTHPMSDALATMAYALARTLDNDPGLIEASLNKELRATLAELAGTSSGEDEDDLSADLSSPVRDSP